MRVYAVMKCMNHGCFILSIWTTEALAKEEAARINKLSKKTSNIDIESYLLDTIEDSGNPTWQTL